MKKKVVIMIASFALMLVLLAGCGIISCEPEPTDRQLVMQRVEQVISAINNKDKSGLKALFSDQACLEEPNIDEQIDELFSFFEVEITSWDYKGGSGSEKINGRERTWNLVSDFGVCTNEEEYTFYLSDWAVETIEPKNKGLYALQVQLRVYEGTFYFQENAGITLFLEENKTAD